MVLSQIRLSAACRTLDRVAVCMQLALGPWTWNSACICCARQTKHSRLQAPTFGCLRRATASCTSCCSSLSVLVCSGDRLLARYVSLTSATSEGKPDRLRLCSSSSHETQRLPWTPCLWPIRLHPCCPQLHARQLEEEQLALEQAPPEPALLTAPGSEEAPAIAHCVHAGVDLPQALLL